MWFHAQEWYFTHDDNEYKTGGSQVRESDNSNRNYERQRLVAV